MDFLNKNYKKCIEVAREKYSTEQQTQLINLHPQLKEAVCGLIIMVKAKTASSSLDTSDWECDFENIVWPELQK